MVAPSRVNRPRYPKAPRTLFCGSPVLQPRAYTTLPAIQTQPAAADSFGMDRPPAKYGGNYSFKRSVGLLSLVTLTHSEEEEELRKILQGVLVRSLDTVENCTVLAVHLWILNPIFLASLKQNLTYVLIEVLITKSIASSLQHATEDLSVSKEHYIQNLFQTLLLEPNLYAQVFTKSHAMCNCRLLLQS